MATLMTMLGGVELLAEEAPTAEKSSNAKITVAVIGLGGWGRELLNALLRSEQALVAGVCDTYPASLKRGGTAAPKALQTADYHEILKNPDIRAVVIATPTHQHKEIVLDAIKAGKHVYREAPLAHSIEDARAIAKAAKAAKLVIFQAGLQLRTEPQRHFLLPFIRSGAIGQPLLARAQWHKKMSWRATSPNPEREKALNWRLYKNTSLGLMGEIGIHQVDQTSWFLAGKPTAVTGFGSSLVYRDDREVPDTVQAVFEYPGGVRLVYDATLANSFDADYEIFYGDNAAVMVRENKSWMFKEVDSPLLGWEVYARKETFYKETGIALVAGASKLPAAAQGIEEVPVMTSSLTRALEVFLRNGIDMDAGIATAKEALGTDDPEALGEEATKVLKRPAAGYLEGFVATVTAIKANEAIMSNSKIELKPDLYELG